MRCSEDTVLALNDRFAYELFSVVVLDIVLLEQASS